MVKKAQVLDHFKKHDPILFSVIDTVPFEPVSVSVPSSYFVNLCRTIIGQQLSTKVADVIFSRFEKLYTGSTLTPGVLLHIPSDTLRSIGMSGAKVRFVQDMAQKVLQGEVNLSRLSDMSDSEVKESLTKIKGVGPWTVEMFCMFTLGREDVFSFGDLGLKRAIQKLYALKKEPSEKTMVRLSDVWRPYRTYAAFALWAYLDTPALKST